MHGVISLPGVTSYDNIFNNLSRCLGEWSKLPSSVHMTFASHYDLYLEAGYLTITLHIVSMR